MGVMDALGGIKRRMYRDGRPGRLARAMNGLTARLYSSGPWSRLRSVTLEVRGRTTGRPVVLPLIAADLDGHRYLVSMLGRDASWVRNVRANDGHAVLVRQGRQEVLLVEVPTEERAPVLRRYLEVAPGARPHVPVDRRAPLADFERIAPDFPVFRLDPAPRDPAPHEPAPRDPAPHEPRA